MRASCQLGMSPPRIGVPGYLVRARFNYGASNTTFPSGPNMTSEDSGRFVWTPVLGLTRSAEPRMTRFGPPNSPILPKGLNKDQQEAVLFGVYPNPVTDLLLTKFYLYEKNEVTLKIVDLTGKEMIVKDLGNLSKGLFYADIEVTALAAGSYILILQTNTQTFKRKLIKQ